MNISNNLQLNILCLTFLLLNMKKHKLVIVYFKLHISLIKFISFYLYESINCNKYSIQLTNSTN